MFQKRGLSKRLFQRKQEHGDWKKNARVTIISLTYQIEWKTFIEASCTNTQQTFVFMKTSFVFVFRRHLQDVLKTSWSRQICSPKPYVFRRRLQDVLVKTNIFVLAIRLQDVLPRCLQNVFKTSSRRLAKTSSRCLQDVLQKHLQDIFKMSSRRFQDVFKTLQDAFETFWRRLQEVFKTSSRNLAKMSSRRIQDVSSSYAVLVNKFSRGLQDVFTTFLRRTAKIDLPIYLDRSV